jgi:predicted nuclease of predicted toxin-antitoxin system
MRFFADHCVPRSVNVALAEDEHEVVRLREELPTDASDPDVIETAQRLDAVLLSLNGDSADIVRYPPSEFGRIIALQVRNRPEAIPRIMSRLKEHVAAHPDRGHYRGKLFLVEAHRIRVRT